MAAELSPDETQEPESSRVRRDPELAVIERCIRQLDDLEPAQRQRATAYLMSRYLSVQYSVPRDTNG